MKIRKERRNVVNGERNETITRLFEAHRTLAFLLGWRAGTKGGKWWRGGGEKGVSRERAHRWNP